MIRGHLAEPIGQYDSLKIGVLFTECCEGAVTLIDKIRFSVKMCNVCYCFQFETCFEAKNYKNVRTLLSMKSGISFLPLFAGNNLFLPCFNHFLPLSRQKYLLDWQNHNPDIHTVEVLLY